MSRNHFFAVLMAFPIALAACSKNESQPATQSASAPSGPAAPSSPAQTSEQPSAKPWPTGARVENVFCANRTLETIKENAEAPETMQETIMSSKIVRTYDASSDENNDVYTSVRSTTLSEYSLTGKVKTLKTLGTRDSVSLVERKRVKLADGTIKETVKSETESKHFRPSLVAAEEGAEVPATTAPTKFDSKSKTSSTVIFKNVGNQSFGVSYQMDDGPIEAVSDVTTTTYTPEGLKVEVSKLLKPSTYKVEEQIITTLEDESTCIATIAKP